MIDNITVLCCSGNSVYKDIVSDCYDETRDAFSYYGDNPVIAHPPCRSWSAFLAHQAKPQPGERALAYHCLRLMRKNGGVLEHPAHSRFITQYLQDPSLRMVEVHQEWWGYPVKKKTWLLMPSHYDLPEIPFNLLPHKRHGDIFASMSQRQRSHTVPAFAEWLINLVQKNVQ